MSSGTLTINAAPQVTLLGTDDKSTKQVPRVAESVPQHLAKTYIFAQRGPEEPMLVSGAALTTTFGEDTFDENSPYFNHASMLVKVLNRTGTAQMVQRLVPPDAGPKANLVLSLDVLKTQVEDYERNEDGSIKYDQLGQPVVIGVIPGYKVKWVATNYDTEEGLRDINNISIGNGDQVDPETNTQSKRYPIMAAVANFKGSSYNNSGIRLWAPTIKSSQTMLTAMMEKERAYPYNLAVITRPNAGATATVKPTLMTDSNITITFKKDVVDPSTTKRLYIGERFLSEYQDLESTGVTKQYGEFGELYVYNDNIKRLLTEFYEAERPYIDEFSDFTGEGPEVEKDLFNFVSGVSSYAVPYHSFQFVDSINSVRLTEYTNIFAGGGSDGTMNNEVHADLAIAQFRRYLDQNDPVQETAINVESIFYDSGYPLRAKKAMCSVIAFRRDTQVVLSTYDVTDRVLTQSEEYSLAVALRTYLTMYPESEYFGTPTARGVIIGRSAKLRGAVKENERYPLTFELAIKAAQYMGAADGKWKNGFNFDGAPGSIVENMYDVSETWVPVTVRNRNWDVGLNWVQAYDRKSVFFPAIKTVYNNDTSVLNSFITMACICTLNKELQAVWREFSGVTNLTNAQLAERVNDSFNKRIKDRFDDRFIIIPETGFTDNDLIRGYSWTTPVKIYAPNMKTFMTSYVQAYRLDDYGSVA